MLAHAETKTVTEGHAAARGLIENEGIARAAVSALRSATTGLGRPPAVSTLDALEADLIAAENEWHDKADLTDSVRADREGRGVSAEDEAIWQAASDRHWAAVDALTQYTPRTPSELLRKARLLTNKGDTRLRTEEQFAELYLKDAEAVSQMAISAVMAIEELRPAWGAALDAYLERRSVYDAISTRWDDLSDEIVQRAPEWNRHARGCDGKPLIRWNSLAQFDNGIREGADRPRRSELEKWVDGEASSLAELLAIEEEIEKVYDEVVELERTLIETPAPDLAAVLYKQRLLGKEADDNKRGYDDPAFFAASRDDSYIVRSWPVFIHEDCLRLAGVPAPFAGLAPFKPRQWLNRFKAAGGSVSVVGNELRIGLPGFTDEVAALMAELGGKPENREALRIWLEER